MAALIQADLSKIGIRVNIVTLELAALIERLSRTSQYEACLLGFTNMAEDPNDQMNVWLSSGPQHAWWPAQKSPATEWEARVDLGEGSFATPALSRGRIYVRTDEALYCFASKP